MKYFGNNTIEIKRIVFTYPDLQPSAVVVELELIHVYRTVGIHLLWKRCDVKLLNSIHDARTHVYKIYSAVHKRYISIFKNVLHDNQICFLLQIFP